jgi:hypothetical protein
LTTSHGGGLQSKEGKHGNTETNHGQTTLHNLLLTEQIAGLDLTTLESRTDTSGCARR